MNNLEIYPLLIFDNNCRSISPCSIVLAVNPFGRGFGAEIITKQAYDYKNSTKPVNYKISVTELVHLIALKRVAI